MHANAELDGVMLNYHGEAEVVLSDGITRRLKDGTFIGGLNSIRGSSATATVKIVQLTCYIVWFKSDLRGVLNRNSGMRSTIQMVFNEGWFNKLLGGS